MSPRTGRPKIDNPKSIRFSIRLDSQTEEKLEHYCNKHQISKGEAIRKALFKLFSDD